MHKAKNINFLFIKKKNKTAQGRVPFPTLNKETIE